MTRSRKLVLAALGLAVVAQAGLAMSLKRRANEVESPAAMTEPLTRDPRPAFDPELAAAASGSASAAPPVAPPPSPATASGAERAAQEVPVARVVHRESVVSRPVVVPNQPSAHSASTRFVVDVEPRAASLSLDGVALEGMPAGGVEVRPGAHQLAASAQGFEPSSVAFNAVAGRTTVVQLALAPKPAPAPPPAVPATAAAPPPSVVTPTPPSPAVPTGVPIPRVSATGSATAGRASFESRCLGCHRISPSMYSRGQWASFLSTGRHDRFVRIGDKVTPAELAAIATYLDENAADAAKDQGAGVR